MEGTILGRCVGNHGGNLIGQKCRKPWRDPYWAEVEDTIEGTILGGSGGTSSISLIVETRANFPQVSWRLIANSGKLFDSLLAPVGILKG